MRNVKSSRLNESVIFASASLSLIQFSSSSCRNLGMGCSKQLGTLWPKVFLTHYEIDHPVIGKSCMKNGLKCMVVAPRVALSKAEALWLTKL